MKKRLLAIIIFVPLTFGLMALSNSSGNHFVEQQDIRKQMLKGGEVYKKYCITCHQKDGGGVPNLIPPLINTDFVSGDKERLIKIVLNGLNENIEIDGDYFTNTMPPLKTLKDQQIADVLTYIRNSFGNKFSAVSVSKIKSVRSKK